MEGKGHSTLNEASMKVKATMLEVKNVCCSIAFCATLVLSFSGTSSCVAQTAAIDVAKNVGISPTGEGAIDGAWHVGADGIVVMIHNQTPLGYHDSMFEWARVRIEMTKLYGNPDNKLDDFHIPSYASGWDDYENMCRATVAGDGWIRKADLFTTNNGKVGLSISLSDANYIVMLMPVE